MKLLLISNGHGEDAIGALMASALKVQGFTLEAMSIVGLGRPYQALDIERFGPAKAMPSGGFIQGKPGALALDLQSGLLALTLAQIKALKQAKTRFGGVLAIGDVVPLGMAWFTGLPFAFVGVAKSDYYRAIGARYLPHEKALMRHARCLAVYARDELTAQALQRSGISARHLGNPMMDGLAPRDRRLPGKAGARTILLLPGSRLEAYRNFSALARAVVAIDATQTATKTRFLAAIAPDLPIAGFESAGWTLDDHCLKHPAGACIHLLVGSFADAAHASDLALATSGTATEQVAGLGKPVIVIPGAGPQFTRSFAVAQSQLLGASIALISTDPAAIAAEVASLLDDPVRLDAIAANGVIRMGNPGACEAIARDLVQQVAKG